MNSSLTICVTSIRSANPFGFGGCIFSGRSVNDEGDVIDAKTLYVVKADFTIVGSIQVGKGQWWKVSGKMVESTRIVDNFKFKEWQIDAVEASLVRTAGEHIVTLLAESDEFPGIGLVKARKLWNKFGESLYEILDERDSESLEQILSKQSAAQLVAAWATYGDTRTLQWLHKYGFNVLLGRKVIDFFGRETPEKIEEDPYRLLSFCGRWKEVDKLARTQFSVKDDDLRRMLGAVEESLYRIFALGHTTGTMGTLGNHLESLLGSQTFNLNWRRLIGEAIDLGLDNGSYVIASDDRIHPLGPMVMEMTVARTIQNRIDRYGNAKLLPDVRVKSIIDSSETSLPFSLAREQRQAVYLANDNAVAVVVGGAGVGKTTVLQTIYQVYDAAGVRIHQVALAGRAAKRMQEATKREASTIASFLNKIRPEDFKEETVIVVDEASMVDIITMAKLCEMLPSHVRLLLAGDPFQLMPVGPGLVLHALVDVKSVPKVKLTSVKRYSGEIADAARAIRAGQWPRLKSDPDGDISFIPCPPSNIADVIVGLYDREPHNTQILTLRKRSADGTKHLNQLCQRRYTASGKLLRLWSNEHESFIGTGFYLGDPVICTRNRWDLGVQNGSLGKLVEIADVPQTVCDKEGNEIGRSIATIEWDDGIQRPVFEELLDDLDLGYAITVHKAQGSQWPIVVVVLTKNRLLDRTIIYTAITRACLKVIVVGDLQAAAAAVHALPKAQGRQIGLRKMLEGNFRVF